jgi:EPS-associated MarR family transcriptional regulator
MSPLSDETRYRLLKLLEQNPSMNQRELAEELGISLGKTNYCLKALIEKGWVKAGNFGRSNNKLKYAYLLTPKGIEEKARVTVQFLKRKQLEYETLQKELEELRAEAATLRPAEERES